MDVPGELLFRRRVAADMPAVYRVFRRALFDYLHRIGQADAATAADPPIEEAWTLQRGWIEHFAETAAEDWVAEDGTGKVVGWALSTERDGMFELTLFFVDPAAQAKGIGRGLLERAFPPGRGRSRAIVATQDPSALSLYLRFGVDYITTAVDLLGRPVASASQSDLAIERVRYDSVGSHWNTSDLEAIARIERSILGHERAADLQFLLRERPAWIARRGEQVVGMAFGQGTGGTGPIGALDGEDLPALIATVESEAAGRGVEEIGFFVPMSNTAAMSYLVGRRFRFDPFFTFILGDPATMHLDRWVITQPGFIL